MVLARLVTLVGVEGRLRSRARQLPQQEMRGMKVAPEALAEWRTKVNGLRNRGSVAVDKGSRDIALVKLRKLYNAPLCPSSRSLASRVLDRPQTLHRMRKWVVLITKLDLVSRSG